jgi:hypothetical protein
LRELGLRIIRFRNEEVVRMLRGPLWWVKSAGLLRDRFGNFSFGDGKKIVKELH